MKKLLLIGLTFASLCRAYGENEGSEYKYKVNNCSVEIGGNEIVFCQSPMTMPSTQQYGKYLVIRNYIPAPSDPYGGNGVDPYLNIIDLESKVFLGRYKGKMYDFHEDGLMYYARPYEGRRLVLFPEKIAIDATYLRELYGRDKDYAFYSVHEPNQDTRFRVYSIPENRVQYESTGEIPKHFGPAQNLPEYTVDQIKAQNIWLPALGYSSHAQGKNIHVISTQLGLFYIAHKSRVELYNVEQKSPSATLEFKDFEISGTFILSNSILAVSSTHLVMIPLTHPQEYKTYEIPSNFQAIVGSNNLILTHDTKSSLYKIENSSLVLIDDSICTTGKPLYDEENLILFEEEAGIAIYDVEKQELRKRSHIPEEGSLESIYSGLGYSQKECLGLLY